MKEMNVGNVCLEQCNGACCRNLKLPTITHNELSLFTPPGTKAMEISEMTDMYEASSKFPGRGVIIQPIRKGVVYDVYLSGDCPNLEDGKCKVYENRPETCRKLEAGSNQCNLIRSMNALPELPIIPLDSITRRQK